MLSIYTDKKLPHSIPVPHRMNIPAIMEATGSWIFVLNYFGNELPLSLLTLIPEGPSVMYKQKHSLY